MLEALQLRTLVIGNSGSGKSRLAEGLGALIHAPVFDLDLIHWKDNGFGAKQDEDVARQKVAPGCDGALGHRRRVRVAG
jgi:adenylate kinase family enzyme